MNVHGTVWSGHTADLVNDNRPMRVRNRRKDCQDKRKYSVLWLMKARSSSTEARYIHCRSGSGIRRMTELSGAYLWLLVLLKDGHVLIIYAHSIPTSQDQCILEILDRLRIVSIYI